MSFRRLLIVLCLVSACFSFTPKVSAQLFLYTKWKTFEGYNDFVRYFIYSPKGNYAALSTGDNLIELYDKEYNKIWHYQGNKENRAENIVFSPDEKYLFFSTYQSSHDIAVMRIADKKIIGYANVNDLWSITHIALSPDGKYLAVGGSNPLLYIYSWENEKLKLVKTDSLEKNNFQYIYTLNFSADNKYLVAAGIADYIYVYSVKGGAFIRSQQIPQKYWVYASAIHPDDNSIVIATTDSILIYRNSAANEKAGKVAFMKTFAADDSGGQTWDITFTHDKKTLVAGDQYKTVHTWDWNNGKPEVGVYLEMHTDDVFSVNFTPDDNYMASASADKTVIIWKSANAPEVSNVDKPAKKGVELVKDDAVNVGTGLTGQNFLLIIGINKYMYWPQLNNATKDAKDIKEVLIEKYQFLPENTFELFDDQATYKDILGKMTEMKKKIGAGDNLLIYFSGHGFYDKGIDEGYWIPVDAHKDMETEYLPNSTLLKYLKAFEAKHIFLVADACFSGSLFSQGSRGYIDNVEKFKSRWGLTSGRLEVVSDGNAGNNSPFAGYFLKFLRDNTKKQFSVSEIIQYVKISVSNNSDQTPIGSPLKNVGDEGGEFIFHLKP